MNTKHLKAKILDLAIRGKLVPQDSSEGNAADLLQKIREEKKAVVEALETTKQKKIKEDKNASFIIKADDGKHYEQFTDGTLKDIEDEIPFEIPENWCWCRLAEICELKGGKRIPAGLSATKEKTNHIYIRVSDMKNDSISDEDLVYIDESIFNKIKQYTISKDDLYLTIAGTIGRVGEVPVKFHNMNLTENALKLTNIGVNKHFLLIFLKTPFVQDYFSSSFHQVAMPKLSMTTTSKTFIPLPPLSEQKRIVTAIEKAFEQIDIIEKNKLNLKTYIKQTKSKVLDLAIHGKLVEQNPQEGNAFELLEKIRNEKSELIKQKKIKEDKNASFIMKADDGKHYEHFADGSLKDIEDEIPFEIPENWCWIKLGEVSNSIIAGGDKPAICSTEKTETNTIPIYANAVTKNGLYGYTNKPQITEKAITISARGTIGFTCIREEPFVPIVRLITLVPNLELIDLKYLKSAFDILLNMTEGSSIPQLTIPTIKTFNLPLPPLSEQKRIVAKIAQVFEQLDVLEKSMEE